VVQQIPEVHAVTTH